MLHQCEILSVSLYFFSSQTRMNVGVAHSEVNPNTRVMNSRGIWLTYALGVGILHIVLLSIPFFSVPVVWTLTNVIHNFVSSRSHCHSQTNKDNSDNYRIILKTINYFDYHIVACGLQLDLACMLLLV